MSPYRYTQRTIMQYCYMCTYGKQGSRPIDNPTVLVVSDCAFVVCNNSRVQVQRTNHHHQVLVLASVHSLIASYHGDSSSLSFIMIQIGVAVGGVIAVIAIGVFIFKRYVA
jgi:hypothetical protein